MKIKKYIYVLSLLLVTAFYSCDQLVEVDPVDEVETNYFIFENRIERGVGAVYANLASIYSTQLQVGSPGAMHAFWLLPGDDLVHEGSGNSLDNFSALNGTNSRVEGVWQRYYQMIARSNFMLKKIEEPAVIAVYTNPALKNYHRGELLFLRAWCEVKLWDWFRKAPLQREFIGSIAEAYLPPSSGFEMLDAAISSLEEAAELLPASWDQRNLGRITKDGAYGLLAKSYAIRANYNNKNAADYGKSIAAFEKISPSRKLVHFGHNFDYRYENNEESLFEFQASRNLKEDNSWLDNGFEGEGGASGQMGAYYTYTSDHWGNYASGRFGPSAKLINAFDPNDPRKAETISKTPDNLGGKIWWVNPWTRFGGYQLVKYVNGARGDIYEPKWQVTSGNNTRLLRLADIKLIAAEAYLALNRPNDALQQINDVRERARKSTPDGTEAAVPAALTSVTMQDIMNERFIELAGEDGHRWTDLRRWHAAGYINLSTWSAADFGYSHTNFAFEAPKHLLFPIPVSELDRNPAMAASGQNPGY
jgi:starch-binding outer membrane protein, SusD/RagB family